MKGKIVNNSETTPTKKSLITLRELIGCITIAPAVGMLAGAPHWALPLFAMGAISAWGVLSSTR